MVASAVTIPSTSSYSYITDLSDSGVITSVALTTVPHSFVNGGVDFNGEVALSSVDVGLPTKFSLDFWLIDATHFIVTDWIDAAFGRFIVTGSFIAQSATPSFSGDYAFTEAGMTTAAQPQAAGGIFTCGPTSTGTIDFVPLGGTVLVNQPITATCGAPVNGRGSLTISGATAAGISQFAAYPNGNQGFYLLELDGGTSGTAGPSGAGLALQQTIAPPFLASALNGPYASTFKASTTIGSQSFAAQVISDATTSALTGTMDVSSFDITAAPPAATSSLGATLSGSYAAAPSGRFPLTITIVPATGQPSPQVTTLTQACYLVDANTCLLLSLDPAATGTGILLLQNTGL
jgi:hypothetical protein